MHDEGETSDEESAVLLYTVKEEDDTQLNRAIELLKMWEVNKGILSGSTSEEEEAEAGVEANP